MIVKTTYPIIVNRKRVSPKDYYLNIDGNNVAEVKAFQDWLDAKFPSGWATSSSGSKYIVGGKASNGYGSYRTQTKNAYATYGAEWEKTRTTTTTPTPTTPTTPTPTPTADETKKDETKKEETKKDEVKVTKDDKGNTTTETKKADGTTTTVVADKNGKVISKKQSGMSKNLKMGLIIGGGVLVLGIIIFAITRGSKK